MKEKSGVGVCTPFSQKRSLKYRARYAFVFSLVNVVFMAFLFTRFLVWEPTGTIDTFFFLLFTTFGHAFFLVFLYVYAPSMFVAILIPHKKTLVVACVLSSLFLLLLIGIDSFVYALYKSHINIFVLRMLVSPVRFEIFTFTRSEYAILLIIVACFLLLEILLAVSLTEKILRRRMWSPFFFGCLISLVLSHGSYMVADAKGYMPVLYSAQAFPYYFGLTAKRFFRRHHITPSTNRPSLSIKAPSILHYPLKKLRLNNLKEKKNILFIGIDSWRFDMLNAAVSPQMKAFADESFYFANHISSGNATSSGLEGLFYGVPFLYNKLFYSLSVSPAFFQVLKRRGYTFSINKSTGLLSPPFYRTIFSGLHLKTLETPGRNVWERDQNITKQALSFMKKRLEDKKPFFAFLFYDAPHGRNSLYPPHFKTPFKPFARENHFSLSNSTSPVPYINRYKNAVFYVDHLVGQIITFLKEKRLWDKTIIVLTGDHGEEFDENHNDTWGHNHGFSPYQIRVPLVIHVPMKKPQVFYHRTSHFDITPFIMRHSLGVENQIKDYSIGQDLMDTTHRKFFILSSYSYTGLLTKKTITTIGPGGIYHLTDQKGQSLPDQKVDFSLLARAYKLMHRYTR